MILNNLNLEVTFMEENVKHLLNIGIDVDSPWLESSMEIWMGDIKRKIMNIKPVMSAMPWKSESYYCHFLSQTFHYVKHSVPLLTACHHRLTYDDQELRRRIIKHISEEMGHENLALSDLKQLGYSLSPEFATTRNLYQTQYFRIMYESCHSFFGYILALEGVAAFVIPEIVASMRDCYGESQLKFLKLHSEEDEGHLEELFKVLAGFTDLQRQKVMQSFDDTLYNYFHMLNSCRQELA